MDALLLDTCIWMETATSREGSSLLTTLEGFVESGALKLLVPSVVAQEFDHHKGSMTQKNADSLRSRLDDAKNIISQFSISSNKELMLSEIEIIRNAILKNREQWSADVARIERLMKHPTTVKLNTTDAVLLIAAQRGLDKKAPFHLNKNSIADAVIFELFVRYVVDYSDVEKKAIFATSNKKDFAASNDNRKPHLDLAPLFTDCNAHFCNNLGDALNLVKSGTIPSKVIEDVIRERDAFPQCPECYEGFLLPGGFQRLTEGLIWQLRCENCGTQFFVKPNKHRGEKSVEM